MAQSEAEIQRQKEMQQAEELLFSGRQELGFAKGLFLGNFVADWVMPYPRLDPTRQTELESALSEVRQMLDRDLDPDWIDRNADIPRHLIDGLARTGVLGMTAPREVGGRGWIGANQEQVRGASFASGICRCLGNLAMRPDLPVIRGQPHHGEQKEGDENRDHEEGLTPLGRKTLVAREWRLHFT